MSTTTWNQARDADEIVLWRRDQLVRAGVPLPLAADLGRDLRYDLHGFLDLLDRGCAAELAVRILSPLDGGDPAA